MSSASGPGVSVPPLCTPVGRAKGACVGGRWGHEDAQKGRCGLWMRQAQGLQGARAVLGCTHLTSSLGSWQQPEGRCGPVAVRPTSAPSGAWVARTPSCLHLSLCSQSSFGGKPAVGGPGEPATPTTPCSGRGGSWEGLPPKMAGAGNSGRTQTRKGWPGSPAGACLGLASMLGAGRPSFRADHPHPALWLSRVT